MSPILSPQLPPIQAPGPHIRDARIRNRTKRPARSAQMTERPLPARASWTAPSSRPPLRPSWADCPFCPSQSGGLPQSARMEHSRPPHFRDPSAFHPWGTRYGDRLLVFRNPHAASGRFGTQQPAEPAARIVHRSAVRVRLSSAAGAVEASHKHRFFDIQQRHIDGNDLHGSIRIFNFEDRLLRSGIDLDGSHGVVTNLN